jgi:hypothetical protein
MTCRNLLLPKQVGECFPFTFGLGLVAECARREQADSPPFVRVAYDEREL